MSLATFTLTCQRDHDPVTLTGQDALDHLATVHGSKYTPHRYASKVKPTPWTAPKYTPVLSAAVQAAVKWGGLTIEHADAYADPRTLPDGSTFIVKQRTYVLHGRTEDGGYDVEMLPTRGKYGGTRGVVRDFTMGRETVTSVLVVKRGKVAA